MELVLVEVIGDPGGDAPQWVRDSWKGIVFEARQAEGVEKGRFILSGEPTETQLRPWIVYSDEALNALRVAERFDAYDWWRDRTLLLADEFLFPADSCKQVAAVR